MDDDKEKQAENQSPVESGKEGQQEVVVIEETGINAGATPNTSENLQPEEIAPDVSTPTPSDVAPPQTPNSDIPQPVYEENKTKYFIIIAAVVVFLIIFFVILGLFFGKKKTKTVTLSYWGLWEDKQILAPIITLYEQKNPGVKIQYEKMAPQDYRDKLLARSKIGQGPDIFRFHNTWLPTIKDLAAPLPVKIMSNEEFEKTFYKIHQKDLKIGNFYYGLPLEIDGLVLIYNDDLFKKIGITTSPSNWDEMTEIVNKFSSAIDKQGNPITPAIAMGTASNVDHFSDIIGLLLAQNGADIKKLDQPEAAGALESFRKFAEAPNKIWSEDLPPSTTAFAQEKVAMIIAPSWVILNIKNANPDIKLKVAIIPSVPGAQPISIASYWVEGVSRYSTKQLEAWQFLRFLTEKENITKLYELEAKTRLFGEPYSRVDLGSLLRNNEYLGPVIKQADNYVSLPLISRTYDNGINDEIITYLTNAVNQTIKGVSYSEALSTAKKGVDQVFVKYKIE